MYKPIAIVSCGYLYPPDSFTLAKFYRNIMNGTAGIREIDKSIWNPNKHFNLECNFPGKTYCKFSGR